MLNKLLATTKKYGMFQHGDRVLACVSGGADSVAMLLLLNDAKDILNISITVAHVNHMIRGSEAERDEDFVRNLANKLGLPYVSTRINIPELAKQRNESIELVARNERYNYFKSLNFDKICTAHTKSDCVETFIMNFSRGCGLHGLTSIPPVRGNIVRPLIDFFREETEMCCSLYNSSYVTDSTNLIDDCTRNKIRLNIIPELNQIFNGFESNVSRCISSIYDDEQCLNSMADSLFQKSFNEQQGALYIEGLSENPPAILSRVVIHFLNTIHGCSPEKKHIDYICDNINNIFSLTLPGGVNINGNGKQISQTVKPKDSQFYLRLSKYDISEFEYNGVNFLCYPSETINTENDYNCLFIDFDSIDSNFTVRTRAAGDEIKIKKRNCTKTIKKLFNELKLSQTEKESALLFEDSKGIFAISGIENKINNSNKINGKFLIIQFRR